MQKGICPSVPLLAAVVSAAVVGRRVLETRVLSCLLLVDCPYDLLRGVSGCHGKGFDVLRSMPPPSLFLVGICSSCLHHVFSLHTERNANGHEVGVFLRASEVGCSKNVTLSR